VVNAISDGMEDSDDKILTRFTSDMNLVIDAFEASVDPADNTYYMFLEKESDKTTKDVYMPFVQEYGKLTVGSNVAKDDFLRTVAHELGHGAYKLRHPFSPKVRHTLTEGSTDNLMDYGTGENLFGYQWELVDDPKFMLTWFMSEDEAAKNRVKMDALLDWIKSNYGTSSVPYDYDKFNEQYIVTQAYNEFTYNEGKYSTIVWLTDKWFGDKTVDMANPYVDIDMSGSFHIEFSILFNFSGSEDDAIKFSTYTYQDFSALLGRMGIKLTDAYKETITDKYTELFGDYELTSDCNKVDVLFEGIPDFILKGITGEERISYIRTLLGCVVNEGGWIAGKRFDTNEEQALLNLFKHFPENEKPDDFLIKLSTTKIGNTPLLKMLISAVDNKYLFIGDDSRKLLMIEFLSLFQKTDDYKNFSNELSTQLDASVIDPEYARELGEKTVSFEYRSIYARTWMDLKLGIVEVDPYLKIDAKLNDQGLVSLNSFMSYGFISKEAPEIKNPRDFPPFAPIIFDQKSSLGALDGFEDVFVAPAIFAYYADKEAGIKTATDITQAGIDVVTLVIPAGQLTKLGRVFFYADKISSVTNLAAGFAEADENVKNVLSTISLITGIVSIGQDFVNPNQTENLSIALESLTKSKHDLQNEFITLVDNINKLSPDELKQIENVQGKLAQFLDGYRKELGLSEDVTADAIKHLGGLNHVGGSFNFSIIKELSEIIPTGKRLTNIDFSQFTKGFDASFINQLGAKFTDDLVNIKQGLDKGGDLTEGVVSQALRSDGYTVVDGLGKYGSNNGYDVVAFKGNLDNPTEIIIVEAKQFKQGKITEFDDISAIEGYDPPSGLVLNPNNPNTGLPTQMSDPWVFNHVLQRMLEGTSDQVKLATAMLDESKVSKYVFAIDKSTGDGYFTKLGSFE
jgi:hypothetical protein